MIPVERLGSAPAVAVREGALATPDPAEAAVKRAMIAAAGAMSWRGRGRGRKMDPTPPGARP